jgi:RNA polymerase sigma-70 factor, ECF subfamily
MAQDIGRTSFDRLMLEHLPAIQQFAIRLCGNMTLAEDIAQESVLRAARSWQTYRGDARFKTWIFQIVVNTFRDHLRARLQSLTLVEDHQDATERDPAAMLQSTELGEVVAKLIDKLPHRQREVLVLSVHEEMENADVAQVLNISEQNVRTNLHLARQRMKQLLEPYLSGNRRNG